MCNRFEGVDERFIEAHDLQEVSVGDYILSGGETAAFVMLDAIIRLLPGVMGSSASHDEESFTDDLLEYPQYTRPTSWQGRDIPAIWPPAIMVTLPFGGARGRMKLPPRGGRFMGALCCAQSVSRAEKAG